MRIRNPNDLFFDQLRDIRSVECQVILTLPELAEKAEAPSLRAWLQDHEEMTSRHKQAVLSIFERHGEDPGGDICKAMKGLIDGGNAHLAKTEDAVVRDLLLVAHCNRIKHYVIAAYEFTTALAGRIGFPRDQQELAAILEEETSATQALAAIASGLFGANV